jgi:hypothetical protein
MAPATAVSFVAESWPAWPAPVDRNTSEGNMPDLIKHERSREARAWLKKEIAEQKVRYRKIEHEMNVTIAKQRDTWIEAFLQRIQTRGYNVHFNMMRKIKPEEIPKKPRRKFKVVY